MSKTLAMTMAAGAALGLLGVGAAQGQIDWNNAGGGSWNVATNWTPNNEPDNAAETAQIALAGSYTVALNASRTIGSLLLFNSAATLHIANATSLSIAGTLSNNDGVIVVNPTGSGNATAMIMGAGMLMDGSGVLVLNATAGVLDRAYIHAAAQNNWTNGLNHTIRGRGRIYFALTNDGTISADMPGENLEATQGVLFNNNLIQAVGGGFFQPNGETINQTGGGILSASGAGSRVNLISATIIGGTLSATGGGRIVGISGTQTFTGPISVTGPLDINNNTVIASGGGLTHSGIILVNAQAAGNVTALTVAAGSTLGGDGTVTLNASGGVLDRAELFSPTQTAFTHGPLHTINGRGRIYYGMINQGLISADAPAETLELTQGTITNTGTLRSSGGGILQLNGETVNQSGAGSIMASGGGNVNLISSVINGGTLVATGASRLVGASGTQILGGGGSISGPLDILNNTHVNITSDYTNNGTITVNSQAAGNVTSLQISAGTTLSGAGTIALNASGGVLDRAQLFSPSQAAWTHGPAHSIRGRGHIYYNLVNNGTITADVSNELIEFVTGVCTNNGLIRTASGGIVQLNSYTVNQSPGGVMSAAAGEIRMVSSVISGGTVNCAPGQRLAGTSGQQTLTGGVVVNGVVDILNNTSLNCPQGLTHSGALTINSQGAGNVTTMNVTAGTTLGGTGTVVLNASGGVLDRAQLFSPSQAPFTHAAGHTIRGRGNIYYGLINEGTITADVPAESLQLLSGTITNNALIRAIGGANLLLTNEVCNQGPGGSVVADASSVRMTTATISGGTISTTNGGRVLGVSGQQTLSGGVVQNGDFDVQNNTSLALPTGLINNGVVTINSQGAGSLTHCQVGNGGVLSGTGSLVLNASAGVFDRAYLQCQSGAMENGNGHTIAGSGNVYATWTNHGNVRPSGPSRRIDCHQGAFTQAADGTLTIEMSANNSNGRLAGPATKNLGGTLRVVLTNGYVPSPCDAWTVVTGPINGTFSAYDFPVLPGGQMHAAYTATTVVVSYVPADYNGDGFPDFFDVDAFIECFEGGACPPGTDADFNHDGFVDFFDLDAFIAAFEEGC